MTVRLLLALLTLATPQGQDPQLNRALHAYDDLDYDSASKLFDGVLADASLSAQDAKLAGFYGGIVYFDLNQPEKARAAFERALATDPTLALGTDASPKLQAFFDGVKADAARARKPDVPQASKPTELEPKPKALPAVAVTESEAEPEEKPLYGKPLFWVGVGATAAVVATGVYLLTRSSGPACASGSGAGCIDLQVQQQGLASW